MCRTKVARVVISRHASNRRSRRRPRLRAADLQPWGPGVAKIGPEAAFRADPAQRQAGAGVGDQPDAGGRGQDHVRHRPDAGGAPARRSRGLRAARAVARSGLRRQGRRDRRRAVDARARRSASTCTSPATSTPSPPRTTCSPRSSTTTCTSGPVAARLAADFRSAASWT